MAKKPSRKGTKPLTIPVGDSRLRDHDDSGTVTHTGWAPDPNRRVTRDESLQIMERFGQPPQIYEREASRGKATRAADLATALRKINNPEKYPTMTPRDVAAYLGIARSTVDDVNGLERVPTGTRKVLFSTASVALVKPSPTK